MARIPLQEHTAGRRHTISGKQMGLARPPLGPQGQHVMAGPAPGLWMPDLVPGSINLASGYPFPEAIPTAALAEAWQHLVMVESDRPFQYTGSSRGETLRRWIREQHGEAWRPGDQLLVTNGAIQAIDLACRAILDRHAAILVQSATYMEALEIFRNYTDHVVSVPMQDGRFSLEMAEALMATQARAGHPVRLIYWGADFQNPTSVVTPEHDRRTLIQLAERYDAWVLEDGAYRELHFGAPLPTLKQLDERGRVVYLGTVSKTLAPGLRIGWAIGAARLLTAMDRLKKDLGQPLLESLVGEYVSTAGYAAHVAWLREAYRLRAERAWTALAPLTRHGFQLTPAQGGFFLWLGLPAAWSSQRACEWLADHGIIGLAGSHFGWSDQADPHAIRLSFSCEEEARMERGFREVARVFIRAQAPP